MILKIMFKKMEKINSFLIKHKVMKLMSMWMMRIVMEWVIIIK